MVHRHCFQLGAILNKPAMHIRAQVILWKYIFIYLGNIPLRVELQNHRVDNGYFFFRKSWASCLTSFLVVAAKSSRLVFWCDLAWGIQVWTIYITRHLTFQAIAQQCCVLARGSMLALLSVCSIKLQSGMIWSFSHPFSQQVLNE